ncbi:histidine phosphatase family protein [Halomonas rhizosphaerae]|uniref:Histidine phosphatase family protein n=1 Tax=Halomonas rhizosphaerae TaxID=3043296 RepID=A0ABT6UYJ1_9GAMM|nr:histidine phosphatase family protein [Halomonas rhizosphaerae]MDI5891058.1 histidine phosphatase family protein [Halomonas rhizosphaerae]
MRYLPVPSRRALLVLALLLPGLIGLVSPRQADAQARQGDAAAWQALAQGGHVALMRHALAPGIGDPGGFALDDCTTQRNLSGEGREQARQIGERFREQGIEVAAVHASRWCRALETAELLGLGEVFPTPALDSFFRDRGEADDRTRAARALIRDWDGEGTLVLVTHQVNITALVGGGVGSGEIVVVRPRREGLSRVGRIR